MGLKFGVRLKFGLGWRWSTKLSLLFSLIKNIKRGILSTKAVDSPHLLKQPSFERYHQNNLSSNYYSQETKSY